MDNVENPLGKKIQISNSPIYGDLKNKIDSYCGMDYESLLLSVSNLATSLCKIIKADPEKAAYYTSLFGLGIVHGGDSTLNYLNSKLDSSQKITNFDILLHNLKKVFSDASKMFTRENLLILSQLFSDNSVSKEIQAVKVAYCLKIISRYYEKTGKYDYIGAAKFSIESLKKIAENYHITNEISIPSDLQEDYKRAINNPSFEITEEEKTIIDLIAADYLQSFDKHTAIEELNKMRIEKKTMGRV